MTTVIQPETRIIDFLVTDGFITLPIKFGMGMRTSWRKESDNEVKVLVGEHVSCRKKPKNLSPQDTYLFFREFRKAIVQTRILILKRYLIVNELVFSFRAFGFFPSYTFPWKWEAGLKPFAIRLYLIARFGWAIVLLLLNRRKKIPHAIWITDHKSKQYFHWFTDALSRLVVAEPLMRSHLLILPDYYRHIAFVKDSLGCFQIPVCFVKPSEKLAIGELILPRHVAEPGNYSEAVIRKIRDTLLARFGKEDSAACRLIYISRAKARRRRTINEDEVVRLLIKYGFEVHYFEDYSLEKQIQLCCHARTVVSCHGAGLTNMLFMPESGQILELRHQYDDHNNCYFSLASALNLDYYYQLCKGTNRKTYSANLYVDIAMLRENLAIMGLVAL